MEGKGALSWGLRPGFEESSIDLDNRHQSSYVDGRKGHKLLVPEIMRMTAQASRNFPQASKGMEALI